MEFKFIARPDAETLEKIDGLVAAVNTLLEKETAMAGELDALAVQVGKNQEVEASAILVIQNIAAQLQAALNSGNPVRLAQLATDLDNSAKALAAAIAANTPTVP